MNAESEFVNENPELLALFSLRPELQIDFQKQLTGRVAGVVKGDPAVIQQVLADLSADKPIGQKTFFDAIKRTRTNIFVTKGPR